MLEQALRFIDLPRLPREPQRTHQKVAAAAATFRDAKRAPKEPKSVHLEGQKRPFGGQLEGTGSTLWHRVGIGWGAKGVPPLLDQLLLHGVYPPREMMLMMMMMMTMMGNLWASSLVSGLV